MSRLRIGQGFDVHRLRAGGPLVLCGVALDCGLELAGHSDADVALHALTDALLGAVADADIGQHFPPTEERWRGCASRVFAEHAVARVAAAGYRIVNCDLTILGEQPKIAPLRDRLRRSVAEILGTELAAVSVKATTTEGLGFVGRGEGLGASAVVLLEADDG